jgi:NADH dehydrogenase FAD-containing subunit
MTSRLHKHRILILGGGYAGLMAAARSARIGSAADITLVNAAPQFVQRIRLHEALAGAPPRQLTLAPSCQTRRSFWAGLCEKPGT